MLNYMKHVVIMMLSVSGYGIDIAKRRSLVSPSMSKLRACGTGDIESQISSFIGNVAKNCSSILQNYLTNLDGGLQIHPGLSFGLGCDDFKSNFYRGSVSGWKSKTIVNWLSESSLLLDSSEVERNSGLRVMNQLNLQLWVAPCYDIPHLKLRLSSILHHSDFEKYSLYLDYTPRVDIIGAMDYYDKYFLGVDEAIYEALSVHDGTGLVTVRQPHPSLLTRLLTSPMAVNIDVQNSDEGRALIHSLCYRHVNLWCDWAQRERSSNTPNSHSTTYNSLAQRDVSLIKLHYDDIKYNMAQILGSDFAPKAAEISLAMLGPDATHLKLD